MLRAIREISPSWVVGENVRGLTNWNGGVVFDEVQADLEAAGYEVTPFLLPACAVNAPHRRDRIWFVAHAELCSNRLQSEGGYDMEWSLLEGRKRCKEADRFSFIGTDGDATNTSGIRRENKMENRELERRRFKFGDKPSTWDSFPSQSPICNGDDGIYNRLDSITFPKWRNESIKAGGNAVVPQVVYQIFKSIEEYEKIFYTYKK